MLADPGTGLDSAWSDAAVLLELHLEEHPSYHVHQTTDCHLKRRIRIIWDGAVSIAVKSSCLNRLNQEKVRSEGFHALHARTQPDEAHVAALQKP